MTDKEAILERHSVRLYESKRIEAEKCEKIRNKIDELNTEGNLHLQFVEDAGKAFNSLFTMMAGLKSAPSVVVCAGPASDDLEEKVGYYGEKLVLFLQQLGLNTCWVGSSNKNVEGAENAPGEKTVLVIALGYGKTPGKARKSKTAAEVTQARADRPGWFDKGVEMALLAPTAINQQHFIIRLNDDDTVEFIDKGGPFSKVDLGIVKCHFEIGAGKEVK
jgi:hypothetical protein